jgi:uncharacterized protein DUF4038/collagenase-like protein with putative collagen-binding domain
MGHMPARWGCLWVAIVGLVLTGGCGGKAGTTGVGGLPPTPPAPAAFPLKASANRRYLVDQNGAPFLIMGDSPQSMVVNLTTAQMATYMADRQARGFNTILVDALVTSNTGGNANGTTYDGIAPFTSGSSPADYDLSTPNPTYFARLDALVSMAASYGLLVMLDPIETSGWVGTLENNGTPKASGFGTFLGDRYKNSPNILWQSGNDFQTWDTNATDNMLVYDVMAGIASADSNHLQTIELNYYFSYANQDTATLSTVLTLDFAYTYGGTYDEVLQAYNSLPTLPVFMGESNYEYENVTGGLPAPTGAYALREQEYWTMTSGGTGSLYGNHYTWTFATNWQNFLDSRGALEVQYFNKLFNSIPWWTLAPDQTHQITTAGYGTYDASDFNLEQNNYCTTSSAADGSLAVVYCPGNTSPPGPFTLTVNLSKFSGPVTAQWYDPSNGTYSTIAGSPFSNSGARQFDSPGNNHDGDPDWVLVLQAP